jgi:hypothetical protein
MSAAGDALDENLDELRLPAEMKDRRPARSSAVEGVLQEMRDQVAQRRRRFAPGLLMAFVAMAEDTLGYLEEESVEDVLEEFDHEAVNARGQTVNTLNLVIDDEKTVRLRPFYNAAEHVFINRLRRYDYPNMAPHATQAWAQHEDLLTDVFELTPEERRAVAEGVIDHILALPEYGRRSAEDASPRPFEVLLEEFPGTQSGEPPGAILQGLGFAYFRADSPNVTIETGKVGAGSRRTGRVGDVDGWNGPELVLSIEVKDEHLVDAEDSTLDGFLANLAEWPDATAIVVARSAEEEVADALDEQAVSLLTRESMLEAVVRWDLNKQKIAAREFYYYLVRVQRHSGLIERFEEFLEEHDLVL